MYQNVGILGHNLVTVFIHSQPFNWLRAEGREDGGGDRRHARDRIIKPPYTPSDLELFLPQREGRRDAAQKTQNRRIDNCRLLVVRSMTRLFDSQQFKPRYRSPDLFGRRKG